MSNLLHIEVENKHGKVKLNEVVTRESIGKMIDEIGKLFGAKAVADGADFGDIMNCVENAVDVLDIEINSPGGSVFDGYTIYQEIQSLKDRGVAVNATITGMAASMASVICMACNKVSIVPHGRMMIHDASSGFSGNAEQMRKQADLLDSISSDIANIYSARTGKDVEEIRNMMKKETWMDAKTTVKNGFADEVVSTNKTVKNNLTEIIIDETNKNGNKSVMSILSRLFPDNDQVGQIEAQIAENEALTKEIEEMKAQISEIGELKNQLVENGLVIADLNEKLVKAEADKAEAETKLAEAEAKTTPEAIQAIVTEELTKCSHKPVDEVKTEEPEGRNLYAEYRELQKTNPRAAAQFWIENESAIKSQ